MPKIAVITKRYYTNKDLIGDRFGRLFHLPLQLVRNGYECTVIAANYRKSLSEKISIDGLQFYSIPLRPAGLGAYVRQCRQLIRQLQPDFIVASGDTHFGGFGLACSKRTGAAFVFDVYDDYSCFGTNRVPLMKTLFRFVVKRSDLVVCASEPLQEKLSRWNRSVLVLENGVDSNLFHPGSRSEARRRLNINNKDKVVGYFGAMEPGRGVDTLLQAVVKLHKRYPELRLLLAGKKDPDIDLNKPYIDYRGAVSQEEIPRFINASDVVVIPYPPGAQVNVSNPCKIAEYLACGAAIVATRVSNIPQILSEVPEALCTPGNAEDMARALILQLESPQVNKFPESLKWEFLGKKMATALKKISK